MISDLPAALFCFLFVAIGAVLVYGTYRRWPMLVDPPIRGRLFYSQSAIRHFFGQKTVIMYTYALGALFIAGGALGLWNGLR